MSDTNAPNGPSEQVTQGTNPNLNAVRILSQPSGSNVALDILHFFVEPDLLGAQRTTKSHRELACYVCEYSVCDHNSTF